MEQEPSVARRIGARIRLVRKKRGYTQQEVCRRIHMSPNNYSKFERGLIFPRIDHFVAILNLLECPADEVFCDVLYYGYQVRATQLSRPMEGLPAVEKERILTVVDALVSRGTRLSP